MLFRNFFNCLWKIKLCETCNLVHPLRVECVNTKQIKKYIYNTIIIEIFVFIQNWTDEQSVLFTQNLLRISGERKCKALNFHVSLSSCGQWKHRWRTERFSHWHFAFILRPSPNEDPMKNRKLHVHVCKT